MYVRASEGGVSKGKLLRTRKHINDSNSAFAVSGSGGRICTSRIPAVRRYAAHTTQVGVYLKRYSDLAHAYTMVNVCKYLHDDDDDDNYNILLQ